MISGEGRKKLSDGQGRKVPDLGLLLTGQCSDRAGKQLRSPTEVSWKKAWRLEFMDPRSSFRGKLRSD